MSVTRRVFLLAPFGLQAAKGVHVNGLLAPADSGGLEGYYNLCSTETGACSPRDAIGIAVHPQGFFAKDFQAMAGRKVQVSIFPHA